MMKHEWRSSNCGYDPADYCIHCGANSYQSYGTEYCQDYKNKLEVFAQKKAGTHKPTNDALAKARAALTREEWDLLELYRLFPHRVKDYIR